MNMATVARKSLSGREIFDLESEGYVTACDEQGEGKHLNKTNSSRK